MRKTSDILPCNPFPLNAQDELEALRRCKPPFPSCSPDTAASPRPADGDAGGGSAPSRPAAVPTAAAAPFLHVGDPGPSSGKEAALSSDAPSSPLLAATSAVAEGAGGGASPAAAAAAAGAPIHVHSPAGSEIPASARDDDVATLRPAIEAVGSTKEVGEVSSGNWVTTQECNGEARQSLIPPSHLCLSSPACAGRARDFASE